MAFKTFVYLSILVLIIDMKVFTKNAMLNFINIIYLIFFIKYLICQTTGLNHRPIVYVENNFELMMLCVLYLIRYQLSKENQLKYLFILGIIICLSFSRSAFLMYAAIFLFVIREKGGNYGNIILSGGLIFMSIIAYYVFTRRADSIEEIDRYTFFMYFLGETKDWNFLQYMTGAPKITALSNEASGFFNRWQNLVSYSGNGSFYSVVFHSYLLRIIFDHGFIGLSAVIFFTYKLLRLSDVDKKITWIVIAIFLLNGLAVSSFNSVFFPLSMIFLMGTKYKQQNTVIIETKIIL
jgi:hypothetical protein